MNRREVTLLQSMKSDPSVSILLPTHRTSPDNKQDPIRVKNLVVEAANRLEGQYAKREVEPVVKRLEQLAGELNYSYGLDALAMFVNKDFARTYALPFAVKERVIIDDTFATRDLVFALNRAQHYWVLALSEQPTRLYAGVSDVLTEVTDKNFPLKYESAGHPPPSPAGRRGIEKTHYDDESHKHFFRSVDAAFAPYATAEPFPLVLLGVEYYIGLFNEVSKHTRMIAGSIRGNFDKATLHELEKQVWPLILSTMESRQANTLKELDNAIGAKNAVLGIHDVWRAASDGRGAVLIVEQGYAAAARLGDDGALTLVDSPEGKGVIDDIVDEAIELVTQKGGRIAFVKDGAIARHGRIALILRY